MDTVDRQGSWCCLLYAQHVCVCVCVCDITFTWESSVQQHIVQQNDMPPIPPLMAVWKGISVVQPPSKCFWSSIHWSQSYWSVCVTRRGQNSNKVGCSRAGHANQWLWLPAWAFLLVFYNNHSPEMWFLHCEHRTDCHTDVSQHLLSADHMAGYNEYVCDGKVSKWSQVSTFLFFFPAPSLLPAIRSRPPSILLEGLGEHCKHTCGSGHSWPPNAFWCIFTLSGCILASIVHLKWRVICRLAAGRQDRLAQ